MGTSKAPLLPPNLTLPQLIKHPLSHAHKYEAECVSAKPAQKSLKKHILNNVRY